MCKTGGGGGAKKGGATFKPSKKMPRGTTGTVTGRRAKAKPKKK